VEIGCGVSHNPVNGSLVRDADFSAMWFTEERKNSRLIPLHVSNDWPVSRYVSEPEGFTGAKNLSWMSELS
jgi:hypothetical protein